MLARITKIIILDAIYRAKAQDITIAIESHLQVLMKLGGFIF